jgi:hypothetical protein
MYSQSSQARMLFIEYSNVLFQKHFSNFVGLQIRINTFVLFFYSLHVKLLNLEI